MVILTYEEHDKIVDEIQKSLFSTKMWFPTISEIQEKIEPYLDNPRYLYLLIYFDEIAEPENTYGWKYVKPYIQKLLQQHEILVDEVDVADLSEKLNLTTSDIEHLRQAFFSLSDFEKQELLDKVFR